jgi:steroid delta-isomerase-like uncharacterized protein
VAAATVRGSQFFKRRYPMTTQTAAVELEQHKTLVRDFLAEFDRGNRDIIHQVFSLDAVFHMPGTPAMNFDDTMKFVDEFYQAFPDMTHGIEDLIAEDDKVVLRLTNHGTHKGEFQGIAPTNKEVTITVVAIYRFEDDKIVEMWEELDMIGLLKQLGVEVR